MRLRCKPLAQIKSRALLLHLMTLTPAWASRNNINIYDSAAKQRRAAFLEVSSGAIVCPIVRTRQQP